MSLENLLLSRHPSLNPGSLSSPKPQKNKSHLDEDVGGFLEEEVRLLQALVREIVECEVHRAFQDRVLRCGLGLSALSGDA